MAIGHDGYRRPLDWLVRRGAAPLSLLARAALLAVALSAAPLPGIALADNPRAAKLLEEADDATRKGDLPKAIIHLKNAVRADPDDLALREQLGLLELRVGDFASAENELALVVERAPDRPRAVLGLGEALLRQRKYDEALQRIVPGQRGDEAEAQVLAIRGIALAESKRSDEALTALRQGVALKATPRGEIALARGLALAGDAAGAEQAADAAVALAPELPDALLLKAELRLAAGDRAAALSLLDKLVNLDGKQLDARLRRAVVRIEMSDLPGAEADLDVVAAGAPKLPIVSYYRALIALRKGNAAAAQQLVDQLPTDFVASNWRYSLFAATVAYANRRFEAADALLRKAQTDAPNEIAPRRLMAILRLRANQPEQAIEQLTPALAKSPDDLSLVKLMAEAYLGAGKSSEAIDLLRRAAQAHPDDAQLVRGIAAGEARAGHPEEALAELEAYAQRDPTERATFMMLLTAYLQRREFAKASDTVARMRGALKDSPLPDYYTGVIAVAAHKFDDARTAFEAAIARDPKFVVARLAEAQLERAANNPAAERKAYEAILQVDAASIQAMTGLAELERRRNQPAEAERWLERAVTAQPEAVEPRILLINQQIAGGGAARAVETAERAGKQFVDNADVQDALGRAYLANKQTEQAISVYRALAAKYPRPPLFHLRLADALVAAGDVEGTDRAIQAAVETDPDFVPAARALIGFALRQKQPERALRFADEFRKRNPKSPVGDRIVGDVLMATGEYRKAADAYAAAADKAPDAESVVMQVQALIRADDVAGAEAVAKAWQAKAPDDVAVPSVLASHYMTAGDNRRAIAIYEQILTHQPDAPVALNNLAWLTRESDPKQALARAEHAWQLAPASPEVGDTLGVILLEQGEVQRAIEVLKSATQSGRPAPPNIRFHLAQALFAGGQRDAARAILEELVDAKVAFSEKDEAAKLLASLRN
jgi:putative PEP-CTERM system TPR-repeat lipoprotein